jgi:L-2-hydroxyglutarate oxidase LhgO
LLPVFSLPEYPFGEPSHEPLNQLPFFYVLVSGFHVVKASGEGHGTMVMDTFEVTVIGAGVVGLAIARELALAGRKVLVVEKHRTFGQETSSRNSEVIHAGIYHPSDLQKTTLCVLGNRLLYEFCLKNKVHHKRIGKIIVAVDKQEVETLEELKRQGEYNGVEGLGLIGKKRIHEMEPEVRAEAALFSSSTGILDSHRFMECLIKSAEGHGAILAFRIEVTGIHFDGRTYSLDINNGEYSIRSRIVVNSAGLHADRIAALGGMKIDQRDYRLKPCKGNYFAPSPGPKLRHLVYPVPHKNKEYLGIHATLDLGGRVRFGPDIRYLKDGPTEVNGIPCREFDYSVDEDGKDAFFEAIRKYLPGITLESLHPDMSGIRPKLQGPGEPPRDFVIREEGDAGFPGFINLIGIESPGLTCSLAIGEIVRFMIHG